MELVKFLPSRFCRVTFHGFRVLWTKFLLVISARIHFQQKSILSYSWSFLRLTEFGVPNKQNFHILKDGSLNKT